MAVDTEAVRTIAAAHRHEPGGLLPALHAIQDAFGHVPPSSVPAIAAEFNLSRAEVHGVITYYHHFRSEPPARHVMQICRAEACQAMGADALVAHAEQRLGCSMHGRSADGRITLEPVYCLGLCASSPSLSVDDEVHARITPQRFDELLAELGSAA
jgi:formate dehydrogenase subunit gamma